MKEDLLDIRAGIKAGRYVNEATVSQGVVQRLLNVLGWPVYDTEVVAPEYSLGGRRADYALCHPPREPVILIEVKQVGQSKAGEEEPEDMASQMAQSLPEGFEATGDPTTDEQDNTILRAQDDEGNTVTVQRGQDDEGNVVDSTFDPEGNLLDENIVPDPVMHGGEPQEQAIEDSSSSDSNTTTVEEKKGSEGLLGGGLLRLDLLAPAESTTTTVESGDSEDYYGPAEGGEGEEGAPPEGEEQQGGPLDQVQDAVGGLTGGGDGGPVDQVQETVGGGTEGLPAVGGGGPVDQVQDTVGGLAGGLL
jgi:hypothetical protein